MSSIEATPLCGLGSDPGLLGLVGLRFEQAREELRRGLAPVDVDVPALVDHVLDGWGVVEIRILGADLDVEVFAQELLRFLLRRRGGLRSLGLRRRCGRRLVRSLDGLVRLLLGLLATATQPARGSAGTALCRHVLRAGVIVALRVGIGCLDNGPGGVDLDRGHRPGGLELLEVLRPGGDAGRLLGVHRIRM